MLPAGYEEQSQPYYSAMLHNDGQYTVLDPHKVYEGTYEEIYEEHIASTPIPAGTPLGKGQVSTTSGGDEKANNLSANRIPLFMDPEQTLSLGVFTAFVAVPLNDQSVPGCGQIGVLPGVSMRPCRTLCSSRAAADALWTVSGSSRHGKVLPPPAR